MTRDQSESSAETSRPRFLVLLRHAIAEERSPERPDADRALTPEGIRKLKTASRGLVSIFPSPELILTSPLRRCVETSLQLAKAYEGEIEIRSVAELRPGASSVRLEKLLQRIEIERVIFVGHEPDLSRHMRALTRSRGDKSLELKKAGAYGLAATDRGFTLEWMLSPRILRRIG